MSTAVDVHDPWLRMREHGASEELVLELLFYRPIAISFL